MPQVLDTEPFFSILSVTKDNLSGLQRTQASVDAQNFGDFEWLIQDGASADGTIEQFAGAGFETAPDRGIYHAMNRLIARARGRYLLFLNAGDAFYGSEALQQIYDAAGDGQFDFIYGDSYENTGLSTSLYKAARGHGGLARGMFTHHQAMVYARRAVDDLLRYDEAYCIAADYDFTARFLGRTDRVLYLPRPICIFESGGVSQKMSTLGRREQYQIRKALKLCHPVVNILITCVQALNWQLRLFLPGVYWFLKRARRG